MSTPIASTPPFASPATTLSPAAARTGWILAISSTLASSLVTPLGRGEVLAGMNPSTLLFVRLLITITLLAITLAVIAPQTLQIERRALRPLLIIGGIAGVEICFFFASLVYVDASTTARIKSTQPLVVLAILAMGGERLTRRALVRMALSMMGIYLLVGVGSQVAPMGLFLLACSLLLYAVQLVLTQWWLQTYDARTVTLYITTIMTVVIGGWWGLEGMPWRDPGVNGWIVTGILAVVSTYFARLALFAAIQRIGSGQIALLWPLQTLGVIILSVLILGERFSLIQAAGGVLILASAALAMERVGRVPWRSPA